MAAIPGQSTDLNDIVDLTIALALRVTDAQRQGELVLKSQIEALGRVASFLREHLNEWPPHLSEAICEVLQILPKSSDRSLILIEFIQSGGFYQHQANKHTLPFVMDLYRILLGRDAEEDAIRHWSAQLNAGKISKKQLLGTVISSEEFRNSLKSIA